MLEQISTRTPPPVVGTASLEQITRRTCGGYVYRIGECVQRSLVGLVGQAKQ